MMQTSYWHLTDRDDWLLLNARLGEGWAVSVSQLAFEMPGALTMFSTRQINEEQELFWENVRPPHRPSRKGALYAFLSREHARRAQWESGWDLADPILVEIVPHPKAVVHVGDARYLDTTKADWPHCASLYWLGAFSTNPRPEVLIHGVMYFPGWEATAFKSL